MAFLFIGKPATTLDQNVYFGALTAAQNGAMNVRKTDGTYVGISTIDAGGGSNWELSSNRLRTATGVTPAARDGDVVTVTTTEGKQIDVTIHSSGLDPFGRDLTNAYSVNGDSELTTLMALSDATLAGKTGLLRDGNFTWTDSDWSSRRPASTFTLAGHMRDDSAVLTLAGAKNLTTPANLKFDGLKFSYTFTPGTTSMLSPALALGSGTPFLGDLEWIWCTFQTNVTDLGFCHQSGGGPAYGFIKKSTADSTLGYFRFKHCVFDGCYRSLFTAENGDAGGPYDLEVSDCVFKNLGTDAVILGGTNQALISDILVYDPYSPSEQINLLWSSPSRQTYYEKSGGWTGAADSKLATFFTCYTATQAAGNDRFIYAEGTDVQIYLDSTNNIVCKIKDTGGTERVSLTSTSTYTPATGFWLGILVSIDMDGTNRLYIWDNNSQSWASEASQAGTGETLNFTAGTPRIGGHPTTQVDNALGLRRIFWATGQALDPTSASVQDAFISTDIAANPHYSNQTLSAAADLITTGTLLLDMGTNAHFDGPTNSAGGGNPALSGTAPLAELDHGDGIQCISASGSQNVTIENVVCFWDRRDGIPTDSLHQGGLGTDVNSGSTQTDFVIQNFVVYSIASIGLDFDSCVSSEYVNVTGFGPPDKFTSDAQLASFFPTLKYTDSNGDTVANNKIWDCVGGIIGTYADDTENNVAIVRTSVANYKTDLVALFDTWTDSVTGATKTWAADVPQNISEFLQAIGQKSGGSLESTPLIGAQLALLDYNADLLPTGRSPVCDLPRREGGFTPSPTDLTNQTAGADVTTTAQTIAGASDTGTLLRVSGGVKPRIQVADRYDNIITAFTSDNVVAKNGEKYTIKERAPATGATTSSITLRAGSTSDTLTVGTTSGANANDDPLDGITVNAAFSISRYLYSAGSGAVCELRADDAGETTADFSIDSDSRLVLTSDGTSSVSTWLASLTAASNAYVRTLYDQSGNSLDFQNTTTSSQPLLVEDSDLGYLSAMDFSAQNNANLSRSTFTPASNTAGFDVYALVRRTATGGNECGIFGQSNSIMTLGLNSSNAIRLRADSGVDLTGSALDTSGSHVIRWRREPGTTPQNTAIFLDGSSDATGDDTGGTDWRSSGIAHYIGYNASNEFPGLISEVIVKAGNLSAGEVTTIDASLLAWGGIS